MKEIVIASNNAGKIREIRSMLPEDFRVLSLRDIGFDQEIEEPYHTFEENAHAKAVAVLAHAADKAVLADDSGLCVEALNGGPGVFSARFAGTPQDEQKNLQRLLHELEGVTNRKAWYKAVICLIWEGEAYFFEGVCHGTIATAPSGDGGFGYDPVFVPEGYTDTFGTLSPEVKHRISHRGRALAEAVRFIRERNV